VLQYWPSCRDLLEAFDMKKHTQQAYMWAEYQGQIKDDFLNLKLIPIQVHQLTGSQQATRIKNNYTAFFPRNPFMKSGFKKINSGQHTGINLGGVLWDILQKYDIGDPVLAITTDNASNNSTLVESLYDIHGSFIIRTPCLAHVMQLALKQTTWSNEGRPKE